MYCGTIAAASKDQDRFITVTDMLPGVFFTGVFDGHAQHGGEFAERAAMGLPKLLASRLEWFAAARNSIEHKLATSSENNDDHDSDSSLIACKTRITKDIETVFVNFQAMLTKEYDEQVKNPLEKARKQMEKSEGIKLHPFLRNRPTWEDMKKVRRLCDGVEL